MRFFFRKPKPFYKKKKFYIPAMVLAFLMVLSFALEPILLKRINNELAFSKVIDFKVNDLDINILWGAVALQDITAKVKAKEDEFLKIGEVLLTVSWSEIFKGRLLADVDIDQLGLKFTKDLLPQFKTVQAEFKQKMEDMDKDEDKDEKNEKDKEKARVASLNLTHSSITLADFPDLKPGQSPHISNIEAHVTNLTPIKKAPTSKFDMKATLLDAGEMTSKGKLELLDKPMKWSVDGQINQLDMTATNQFLKNKVPLTFTKGKLDLYAEAKSEGEKIEGYVKPFLGKVDVIKSEEDFKGPRHWIIELITAVGNLGLRSSDEKNVATKVPFVVKGDKIDIDKSEGIKQAMEHGLGKPELEKGIENEVQLKK